MQMSACSQLLWQHLWAQPSPVRQICTAEYSKVLFQTQYGFIPADTAFIHKVNSSTILFFFFFFSLFSPFSIPFSQRHFREEKSHNLYWHLKDTAEYDFIVHFSVDVLCHFWQKSFPQAHLWEERGYLNSLRLGCSHLKVCLSSPLELAELSAWL